MTSRIIIISLIFFTLQVCIGCGGDQDDDFETKKVKPNRNTFTSGTTSSEVTKESISKNNEEANAPLTVDEHADQWQENLKVAEKNIRNSEFREYLVDPKGPGTAAIKAKVEQVGEPIIYVKKVSKKNGNKSSLQDVSFAKIKLKITLENTSKQDCMKTSIKLTVKDNRGRRMINRENSFFFKQIPAGKVVEKEIVLEDFNAWQNKRTQKFAINFGKAEVFVTDAKFYFN